MIIDRNVSSYVINTEDSLADALRRISTNKARFVFCVDEQNVLRGILTDGDFRRWVIAESHPDLMIEVGKMCRRECITASVGEAPERISALLSDRITVVPLVDEQGHLCAIARPGGDSICIGGRQVGPGDPCFVIAEIGNNHNGDVGLALRLIDEASRAGADCAKFQMRSMAAIYRNAGNVDDMREDLGAQYTLDLLARTQLSNEDMLRCFDRCHDHGMVPLCTPWDAESARILDEYGIPGFKVASADLTNHDLLTLLASMNRPLLVSTGMSDESEIREAVGLLRRHDSPFILLHCNSTYPAPFKDINLRYLRHLAKLGDCPVGYSGHERGWAVAVAAVAMGAKVIEKHFTVDRSMEGNDHKVSLLPTEFRAMVDAIRQTEEALGSDAERKITQGERINRENLAKSLVAATEIKAGEIITVAMVDVKSPGRGLQPNMRPALIGRVACRNMLPGDFFYTSDIEDAGTKPRAYSFRRKWGVPVRYHDVQEILAQAAPDLVEFHFSFKDLEIDPGRAFERPLEVDLVVHAPELFAREHTLDLASTDEGYRYRSISEMQRVINITRAMKPYFPRTARPLIITNVGGFTQDAPIRVEERTKLYDLAIDSLSRLDSDGVEIIPQTMPPYPWHFGGQRYHNLFMDADEIANFCLSLDMRICLDVSHSRLACNTFKWSFTTFLKTVAPHVAHLHLVDARGTDEEGLQIGDGDIDFATLADILDLLAPKAPFIPEIWQGHKNHGEGFWIALDRLDRFF